MSPQQEQPPYRPHDCGGCREVGVSQMIDGQWAHRWKNGNITTCLAATPSPSSGLSIEDAWRSAENAYQLPDDGIVDWSVTLWHDSSGWHAEGWRSDTTQTRATGYATAVEALHGLALAEPGSTEEGPLARLQQEPKRETRREGNE